MSWQSLVDPRLKGEDVAGGAIRLNRRLKARSSRRR